MRDICCEVCEVVVGQWNYDNPNGTLVSVRCSEHGMGRPEVKENQ